MPIISKELWKYANRDSGTDYSFFHSWINNTDADNYLYKFLNSTMDEIRLHFATEYSDTVLSSIDAIGGSYFRRAVLRREITSEIDYHRQRDHQAHTLYNYLLGWYLFSNCQDIKDQIRDHIVKRLNCGSRPINNKRFVNYFGGVWAYVSLMHDIGYLLEGSIAYYRPEIQNKMLNNGTKVVNNFFKSRFWKCFDITSWNEINLLSDISKVPLPSLQHESMEQCADSLTNLGKMENLRNKVMDELTNLGMKIPGQIDTPNGFKSDAFDLWKTHYDSYDRPVMSEKIEHLKTAFQKIQTDGIPKKGTRLIDHGVASGLILLQYATHFYKTYAGLCEATPKNEDERKICRYIQEERSRTTKLGYESHWWWTAIVWATAATSIHNIQQLPTSWPGCGDYKEPLSISEDPLAFLGILVDIIQEWDRHSIHKDFSEEDLLPIQSSDVKLSKKNSKVIINYNSKTKSEEVIKALDASLEDWKAYVRIIKNKK